MPTPMARAIAPVLVLIVFWFDLLAPPGAVAPVLYIVPILLFIRRGQFWEPLLLASGATVATLAVAIVNHGSPPMSVETLNLPLELTTIWVSGISVAYHRWTSDRWSAEIERVNAARGLAEARLLKQESLTQLGELAAVVAHEVRNPLAGFRGTLEVLEARPGASKRDQQIIRAMIERIDALNSKVTDLLRFASPRDPVLQPTFVAPLVADVVESACDLRNGVRPHVTAPPGGGCALADPEMLRAVLLNLLLNAQQASPTQVEVRVKSDDNRCRVQIADDGCGLPTGAADQVFEPFYTTKRTGTGLGLSIVKRLMELQNGAVTLEPRAGGGTVAEVTLPAAVR